MEPSSLSSTAPDPAVDPRTPDILDIVAKETQLDRTLLTLDASIEGLGIPSLDMVQTIFEIEARYDVEIPVVSDRAGAEFTTIGDLVAHVLQAINAAKVTAPGGSSRRGGGRLTRRVAITGLGAIASTGADIPSLWHALQNGVCGIGPITTIATERLSPGRVAAEIHGFDPLRHFDAKRLMLLDRAAQLALVAAREAVRHSGIDTRAMGSRGGVVLGAAIGQETIDSTYKIFYGDGSNRIHPFTVPRLMPSSSASHVSMEFGLRGPTVAMASACASANHAIGHAFQMIRAGMLDMAITGGGDAPVVVGVVKAWEALRVLSPDVCRPFSADRAGLVIGEGAAMLVLEAWDHAVARGASIHGELIGFGCSADAGDITAPDASGGACAMRAALEDAGLPAEAVQYVNAHGTGTRLNDRTEVAALRAVFGAGLDRIAVSSNKSMLGHCMTASGALELIASVLSLQHGIVLPTIGFTAPDPECAIDCVPNLARAGAIEVALSNSFAFGGLNATVLVRRVEA